MTAWFPLGLGQPELTRLDSLDYAHPALSLCCMGTISRRHSKNKLLARSATNQHIGETEGRTDESKST